MRTAVVLCLLMMATACGSEPDAPTAASDSPTAASGSPSAVAEATPTPFAEPPESAQGSDGGTVEVPDSAVASDGDDLSAPDPSEPQAPTGSSQQPQKSDDDASTQPQPAPEPEPAPEPQPAPEPEPAPEPQPAPEPEPAPEPQPTPEPQPAPDDDQNADSNAASGSSTVAISDFDYQPGTLTVPAGTTITWRNSDVAGHTVTADDSTFDSQRIAPDGSFSVTLDQPGTYTYHCEFHPNMEATIEVTG